MRESNKVETEILVPINLLTVLEKKGSVPEVIVASMAGIDPFNPKNNKGKVNKCNNMIFESSSDMMIPIPCIFDARDYRKWSRWARKKGSSLEELAPYIATRLKN